MPDLITELRAFGADLDEYARTLGELWRRAPGDGWFSTASEGESDRIDELRASLHERYGGLHDAIVEALGHEPVIEQYGIVGGDVFQLAFADPADNPWLSAALDLAPGAVRQAIGYHRMRRGGRVKRAAAVVYRELKDWARIAGDAIAKIAK